MSLIILDSYISLEVSTQYNNNLENDELNKIIKKGLEGVDKETKKVVVNDCFLTSN